MDDELVQARLQLLEAHVENLIERVHELETKPRAGRKAKPILVKAEGVCGVDPDRESSTCPDASLYRSNSGCKGDACRAKAKTYYESRK